MAADSRVIFSTELDDTGVKNGLNNLGGTIKRLAFGAAGVMALRAIGMALGNVARSAMQYNSQMEQYFTSFSTLLGSEQAAAEKIAYLKAYAAKTPFEMTDLANAEKTLLGFGVASNKADTAMQQLGDISQGNSERFSSLALVYGQMSSTGKLMGQDLLQMINAGFNPLTAIAEKTGTSIGDLKQVMAGGKTSAAFKAQLKDAQKEVKKLGDNASDGAKMLAQIGIEGQISSDLVDKSMQIATSSGGRFYQAMEKQSKTAAGLISTLKDNVNMLGGAAFESLSEAAKAEALPAALGYVDTLTAALQENGIPGMMGAFGGILGDIAGRISSFAPQLAKIATGIVKSFATGIKNNAATIAKGLTDAIKSAAMGLVSVLPVMLDTFISIALELVDGIAIMLPDLLPKLVEVALDAIVKILTNVPRLITVGLNMAEALVKGILRGLASLVGGIIDIFADTTGEKVSRAVSNVKANIKPKLSEAEQQKITDAVQSGYDAAKLKIQLETDEDTAVQEITDKIDAAFADGKLTKKEGNALGKDLKTYIDEAKGIAEEYVASGGANASIVEGITGSLDETYAEYEALVKKITTPGYKATAEETERLKTLVETLLNLRTQLQEATSEALLLQQAKARKVKLGVGTSDDFSAAASYEAETYQSKVAKAQDKLNSDNAQFEANIQQAEADLANGEITRQEFNSALEVIADDQAAATAEYTETVKQAAEDYNTETAALYAGMAKANPEAAAALQNLAALRDRFVEVNAGLETLSSLDFSSEDTLSKVSELYKAVLGVDMTDEQKQGILSAINPEYAVKDLLSALGSKVADELSTYTPEQAQNIANIYGKLLGMNVTVSDLSSVDPSMLASLSGFVTALKAKLSDELSKVDTSDDALQNNPMATYLQTLWDTGAFDTLDVTKATGALASALKSSDLLENMKDVGDYMVGGTLVGIGKAAENLTPEDFAALNTHFINNIKPAFGINSPAKTMYPVGEQITAGIGAGMIDDTAKASIASYAAQAKQAFYDALSGGGVGSGDDEENGEESGGTVVDNMADGAKANNAFANMLISKVRSATSGAASLAQSQGNAVGAALMRGIQAGLNGMSGSLNSTMRAIIAALLQAARDAAGVRSPSTLFRDQLGKYLAQGVGVGFTGTMNSDVLPAIATSIGLAAKAGQDVLDNTLLAKVQRITGLQLPNVSGLTSSIMRGSAISQASASTSNSSTTAVDARQYITFESTMQAPDEIARTIRRQRTYGLAGAR